MATKFETKHVPQTPLAEKKLQAEIDRLCKEAKSTVRGQLDQRWSYKDEGPVRWQAYGRRLLANGHTIFINLQTMAGTISKEIDKWAIAKIEKREKRLAKREERREVKAARKESEQFDAAAAKAVTVKADKAVAKAAKKVSATYDPGKEVLKSMAGVSTASK